MNAWVHAIRELGIWLQDRWRHEGHPESLAFDETHGVDTARWTLDYEPVRPTVATAALKALPDGARGATFVDLGCGKGRACLVASLHPFGRVLGVEVVEGLVNTARANARTWSRSHPDAAPIEVLHADATTLPLPLGPLVVFLYNPFGAEGVQAVRDRLAAHPDPSWLIYINPLEAELLTGPIWHPLARGGEGDERWLVYAPSS